MDLVKASDRRAFFSIFLSFLLCCVSGCLLKQEGSSFMAFYLYPSVVIDSGWLPVSTAVCSRVWICTCIWVALQKAAWHVTSGLLRGSEDKQFSTKYSAAGWCSGLIISVVRLCSVPSPPLATIGASITLISAHLRKRPKGRRSKYRVKWKRMQLLESWFNMQEIWTTVRGRRSEKESSHSA